MVYPVKEFFQVQIDHDGPAFRYVSLRLGQGVVRPASRSKAVAGCRKGWVQQRFQHLQERLLHEPVDDCRDAQLSHPAARFGDLRPPHRLRFIRTIP